MKHKKISVYVALPLTGLPEAERPAVCALMTQIESMAGVKLLKWAFNPITWQPVSVPNIQEYDTERVMKADLAVFVFWSGRPGSDGRGAELAFRLLSGKPVLVVVISENGDIQMSRFPHDLITQTCGLKIQVCENVLDVIQKVRFAKDVLLANPNHSSFKYKRLDIDRYLGLDKKPAATAHLPVIGTTSGSVIRHHEVVPVILDGPGSAIPFPGEDFTKRDQGLLLAFTDPSALPPNHFGTS